MPDLVAGNAAIGQSGGPTAVINQSLAGVVEGLRAGLAAGGQVKRIFGMRHGVRGLVKPGVDGLLDLTSLHKSTLEAIARTPSAALGSTRDKPDEAYCDKILDGCRRNEIRYFFYITNLTGVPAHQIVRHANKRCNQENLIAQLKTHAIKTTGSTLQANWAWMAIASLAWTLKSWFALMADQPAERKRLLGMELRTFVNQFMAIPVQIIRAARRTTLRILGGHLPSLPVFLRIWADIRLLRRIRI